MSDNRHSLPNEPNRQYHPFLDGAPLQRFPPFLCPRDDLYRCAGEPLGLQIASAQSEFMPCKRKSEANDHPAKRPPTCCHSPSVEQWLTTTSPAAEPSQKHKRARSEEDTTGTVKKRRFYSGTSSLQLTRETLHQLEAETTISPTFMGSRSERSGSSERADSLSAYNPRFTDELERRNIHFADHQDVPQPQNLVNIVEVIDKREENAPHLGLQARNYRKILDTSGNEADVIQSLVPKVLPVEEIRLSDNECTIANQQWAQHVLHHSELRPSLAAPKPDQVFGFRARSFRSPRALARRRDEGILAIGQVQISYHFQNRGTRFVFRSLPDLNLRNLVRHTSRLHLTRQPTSWTATAQLCLSTSSLAPSTV